MRFHNPVYLVKRLFRPVLYQGPAGTPRRGYFEGWYFKSVFQETAFAVIPGVSYARGDVHAFIQTLIAGEGRYHRFPIDAFRYRTREFGLQIGENRFSLDSLDVQLPELRANLSIVPDVCWPSSPISPSSMGWYAYMRFMECYHGIIVVDGTVSGDINGRRMENGRFYLEKDWGTSFPKGWIWLQSNSFPGRASITCSIAQVPFRRRVFTGFIAALWDGETLHRFATYTGSRIHALEINEASVHIVLSTARSRLSIKAHRPQGGTREESSSNGGELISPVEGAMEGRITESIDASVEVALEEGGRTLFSGTGTKAGLEVVNPDALSDSRTD